jgi:hypothetical protein
VKRFKTGTGGVVTLEKKTKVDMRSKNQNPPHRLRTHALKEKENLWRLWKENKSWHMTIHQKTPSGRMHGMKTKPKQHLCAWRRKETKMKDACCALYVTALVAYALELETTVLHVPDPTVGCICTATMVAIPLFPIIVISFI